MSTNIYRLGTANMYDNALRNLGTRQTNLSNLQENLTSGKRVVRASDDPVSAAQAERAITRLSRIQTEQRALETQRNAIAQAESSLGDAVALVQNFRELVVQAGGAQVALELLAHGGRRHRVVGAGHQQHGARAGAAPVLVEQVEAGVHRGDAGDVGPGAQVLQRGGAAEAVAEEGQRPAGELRLLVQRRVGGGDASHPPLAVLGHAADARSDLVDRGGGGALAPHVRQEHRVSGVGEPPRVADHLLAEPEGVVEEQDRGR